MRLQSSGIRGEDDGQKRMPDGNNESRGILRQIDFSYTKNDFVTGKNRFDVESFNILRQKTFWNYKTDFVVRKTIFLHEKSICYEIFQHSVTKTFLELQNGFCFKKNDISA